MHGGKMIMIDILLVAVLMVVIVKYLNLQVQHQDLEIKHWELIDKWNILAKRVNAQNKKPQLIDQKLVKQLIVFCHPDKHDNSARAKELTQELLRIRDSL